MGIGCNLVMVFLTGLLFWEYQFFKKEIVLMQSLQREYHSYVDLFKQATKKKEDTLQVKKVTTSFFPEGARIFSSDEDACAQDSLVLLNRGDKHLKRAALTYYKEQATQLPDTYNSHYERSNSLRAVHELVDKKTISSTKKKRAKPSNKKYSRWTQQVLGKDNGKKFFSWPIAQESFWLSSFFGPRKKPNGSWGFHYGIDMAALKGTPVRAAAPGVVIEARYTSGYGNTIVIMHNNRYKTRYAHLEKITVRQNKAVTKGDVIGTVGATGFTIKSGNDASHLHFEVYDQGKQINPLYLLS